MGFYERVMKKRASESADGWAKASIGLINDVQNRSKSWFGEDEYKAYENQFNTLLSQAGNWRQQYAGNKEALSDIDSVSSALSQAKNYTSSNWSNYSKFGTADEYQAAVKRQQDHQNKWGHYTDAVDFEEYKAKGTQVSNPSWDDSKAPVDLFGWKPFGDGADVADGNAG